MGGYMSWTTDRASRPASQRKCHQGWFNIGSKRRINSGHKIDLSATQAGELGCQIHLSKKRYIPVERNDQVDVTVWPILATNSAAEQLCVDHPKSP